MYQLLDTGNFQKLEQIGPYRLVRPAAQAVWRPRLPDAEWRKADARYTRFSGGDGKWEIPGKRLAEQWSIDVDVAGTMLMKLTDFGHLGIFPEQHSNWGRLGKICAERKAAGKQTNVLNLFAYTGGSTLACAKAGASVAHVDASKTSVDWAKKNAEASGYQDRPIRWLVDDAVKFTAREVRRETRYHGVILDPPSYGRGPKGETWKIEEMLPPLLDDLKKILADDFAFILLSAHSTGYTPLALTNLIGEMANLSQGEVIADEMIVTETGAGGRPLPSGASALFARGPQ